MAGGEKPTIRIFVSSPADVMAERERVDRIASRLNAAFAGAVAIETLRWETNYYTADRTFQHQIADPGACDVVVSIFWQRLGSELPPDFERMADGRPYPSGTVYELTKALQASERSASGLPHVLVYRKTADVAAPMTDRERYRQFHEQREAFLAFWEEWFVSEHGHFKAAYNSFQTTDEFEAKLEAHLRAWLVDQGHMTRHVTWSLAENGSPFCGLEPFDAGHEEVFFGRTRDIDRAIERLGGNFAQSDRQRFLLLLGESGSGKSSLVSAGIVPRVLRGALGGEPAAWRVAWTRPGAATDPLTALAQSLFARDALPEIAGGDFRSAAGLAVAMASGNDMATTPVLNALNRVAAQVTERLGSDAPAVGGLVIVIDQLEQLFTPAVDAASAKKFAVTLNALARTGRVAIIATLRSDAYADFARSPSLLALKEAGSTLDVTTPGAAEIAEIVRAPAAAAGLSFGVADAASSERLDDVIIRAASGRDALPLLQFTLSRLYDAMRDRLAAAGKTVATAEGPDLTLTFADYHAFGGLEGAIGERAEEAFRELGPDAQQRLPRLLRALAQVEQAEGRNANTGGLRLFEVPWESLATDASSAALVQALIDARILVASNEGQAGGQRRVRLAHEAVLRTWRRAQQIVTEHRDFFRIRSDVVSAQHRFARQKAEHSGADAFMLPRGVPLAEAEWIRKNFADELDADVVAFIDQSSKRARRRQRLMAAATVVFALTALGAGIAAFIAMQSERRAARNFDLAIAQADALILKISEELKDRAVSRDSLQRILDAIERQFGEIARAEPNHPRLLLSRARMLTAFVDNYIDLGESTEALRRSEECVAITRRLVARVPDDATMVAGLGNCLERLGTAYYHLERINESIASYRESANLRRQLVAQEPLNVAWQRDLADALRFLGYRLVLAERKDESMAALDEAIAISRQIAATGPDDPQNLRLMADNLNVYGIVLVQLKRYEEALGSYQEGLQYARRLVALDSGNATWKRYLSNILTNSSIALVTINRRPDALKALQESLSLRRDLVMFDPGNMTWQRELSYILVEVANLLIDLGRTEEALVAYREAVAIVRRLLEIDTGNVAWKNELRRRLPPVVHLLVNLGQREEAITLLKESVTLFRESVAANPNDVTQHFELGFLAHYLGRLLFDLNRTEESLEAYQTALTALRRYVMLNPGDLEGRKQLALVLRDRAQALMRADRQPDATEALRESVGLWRAIIERDNDATTIIEFVDTLRQLAALDPNPRPLFEEALALLRKLDAQGSLQDRHRLWIGEITKQLAARR